MSETITGVLCPLLVVKLGPSSVYDSETVRLIASLVYSPCSELRVTMMDVEKQMTVAFIAYVHSKIRSHLATCLENGQVSRFPVLGERKSAIRKPRAALLIR